MENGVLISLFSRRKKIMLNYHIIIITKKYKKVGKVVVENESLGTANGGFGILLNLHFFMF